MSVYGNYVYPEVDPPCPVGSSAYTIRSGDTLYTIAQRLRTTVTAITALNPGVNPNQLQVGQVICVPGASPTPIPGSCPGGTGYVIQAGDTFYALASRYGVSVQALINANPNVDPSRLVIGQTICIPGGAPTPQPVLIRTPVCSLIQPVLSAIPGAADIPIGSVTIRQVAMSTRAYTIAAAPLPDPASLGNYNSYIGVLNLITDDPASPRATVNIRLVSSNFGNQLTTWAGTIITTDPPIVGDTVEIRPFNSSTGAQGNALLRSDITACG